MDPVSAARALVEEMFPGALYAFVGGSVLTEHRTGTTDLDVVVVLDGLPRPYRESLRWRGWPVELFVHTPDRLAEFLASELARRKPTTHRMLARGVTLIGDPGDLPARCARVLAEGPPPLTVAERDRFRYCLTDALDDYAHVTDPGERVVIGSALWTETARAALAFGGRWISGGKWLLRELREFDPGLADRWLAARDPAPLAEQVLAGVGGPLFDGYRA